MESLPDGPFTNDQIAEHFLTVEGSGFDRKLVLTTLRKNIENVKGLTRGDEEGCYWKGPLPSKSKRLPRQAVAAITVEAEPEPQEPLFEVEIPLPALVFDVPPADLARWLADYYLKHQDQFETHPGSTAKLGDPLGVLPPGCGVALYQIG